MSADVLGFPTNRLAANRFLVAQCRSCTKIEEFEGSPPTPAEQAAEAGWLTVNGSEYPNLCAYCAQDVSAEDIAQPATAPHGYWIVDDDGKLFEADGSPAA